MSTWKVQTPGYWILHRFFSLGDLNRATLYFLIKHIGGGGGWGREVFILKGTCYAASY